MLLSLILLVIIGRLVTGAFEFLLTQFWFTSGILLLVLLSLVDQPHFSKDANVFANGVTAWVSLLLVPASQRSVAWWAFLAWGGFLVLVSSYLMWVRKRNLEDEPPVVQFLSRINRQIGRPEAIFSALFLWGAVLQFGARSEEAGALFIFWAVFMILNLPALARLIDKALTGQRRIEREDGVLDQIISPRVAQALLTLDTAETVIGRHAEIWAGRDDLAAEAVMIDDRIVAGARIGRLAITTTHQRWQKVGMPGNQSSIRILGTKPDGDQPVSFVDAGSEIGKLVFQVPPELDLQSGEVVWTQRGATRAYYQVISAIVREESAEDGNSMHEVRVAAGELGNWDAKSSRFEPINWVAPAGQLVYRVSRSPGTELPTPPGCERVGWVPNSDFPVHAVIEDAVTHNTAIIGVTGSGKSFLAFHLIEAMARSGIKVLILDVSRQHDIYLQDLTPTPLRVPGDVATWMASESPVGIHQFALDTGGLPKATADFAAAAFAEVSTARLERGRNIAAKLCVVFEEAHSLIPEWNQVAQRGDEQHVNSTARSILQGRKYGMGALVITQRTANVTKTILNQCNTIFALQSFDQTGLDFLRNYMGEEYSQAISTLPLRHAILVGKASSSTRPLLIRIEEMGNRWTEPVAEPPDAEESEDPPTAIPPTPGEAQPPSDGEVEGVI